MPTIIDIARVVGIAPSTVARALRDHPHISDATKEKVRAAADQLGYVPHAGARTMRGGASTLIGFITPEIEQTDLATMAKAVGEICNQSAFQLVLSVTDDDPAKEHDQIRALVGARAAGVVIVPSAKPHKDSLQLLKRVPHVQLVRHLDSMGADRFLFDDEYGLHAATSHLTALGHQRIAYIGGSESISTGADRLRGYRRALREASIKFDAALVGTVPPVGSDAGALFTALYRKSAPSAIVLGGPGITLKVLEAIDAAGIRVPQQLSVVGFADQPWVKWWGGGLTTVALPAREIGLACGDFLLRKLRQDVSLPPPEAFHAALRPTLIVRHSTASARDGNRKSAA